MARSKFTKAMKHSKRQCWTELLEVVDEDPWENPYKVVMTRPKSQSLQQATCPEQLEKIVSTVYETGTLRLSGGETRRRHPLDQPRGLSSRE